MNSSDEKIIELSKSKIALAILGTCAFVAIGVWMLSFDEESIRSSRSFRLFFNNPMYVRGAWAFGNRAFWAARNILFQKAIRQKAWSGI